MIDRQIDFRFDVCCVWSARGVCHELWQPQKLKTADNNHGNYVI